MRNNNALHWHAPLQALIIISYHGDHTIITWDIPVRRKCGKNNKYNKSEYEESFDIEYECSCSVEKFIDLIATLPIENIEEMINEDGHAETVCHFCGNKFYFDKSELEEIKEKAKR